MTMVALLVVGNGRRALDGARHDRTRREPDEQADLGEPARPLDRLARLERSTRRSSSSSPSLSVKIGWHVAVVEIAQAVDDLAARRLDRPDLHVCVGAPSGIDRRP